MKQCEQKVVAAIGMCSRHEANFLLADIKYLPTKQTEKWQRC